MGDESSWKHVSQGVHAGTQDFPSQLSPSQKPQEMNPQRTFSPSFSLLQWSVYPSFPTQMRSPSSPSISPFSPFPSNILVTSSHRGTPSVAFFGCCNFTQVLALVGRVIRSCCGMMTAWLDLSTSGEETARSSDERLHSCGVLLRFQSPALRTLVCPCSTRTWGFLEADVTLTILENKLPFKSSTFFGRQPVS